MRGLQGHLIAVHLLAQALGKLSQIEWGAGAEFIAPAWWGKGAWSPPRGGPVSPAHFIPEPTCAHCPAGASAIP